MRFDADQQRQGLTAKGVLWNRAKGVATLKVQRYIPTFNVGF